MNKTEAIQRLLENAGLRVLDIDNTFIHLEDPSCILRSFETFLEYAWTALMLVTGGLLLGWGISMIRGAKNDIKENLKRLVLIFGILSATGPILNIIYGGDFIGAGCDEVLVALDDVNDILAAQSETNGLGADTYEDIDIYDSGVQYSFDEPSMEPTPPDISHIMEWEPPEPEETEQ